MFEALGGTSTLAFAGKAALDVAAVLRRERPRAADGAQLAGVDLGADADGERLERGGVQGLSDLVVRDPVRAVGAAKADRSLLMKAFNPASLGLAVASLAGVALATKEGRPSGLRPLRRAPDFQPDVEELP